MITIKQLMNEQAEEGQKLKHIEHLEDHPIDDGQKGFERAVGALHKVKSIIDMKQKTPDLTMKHDGAPSIVYGHHPDNGKFFVATKSAFNKTPKINYTSKDVENNHGVNSELSDKLKSALEHLPKISPKKGVFQGDMMFYDKNKHETDGKVHFKPNTINYSTNKNSEEGKKISKAKFGVYTHTEYRGDDSSALNAHFDPDLSGFKHHEDVYHREPGHDTSKVKFHPEDEKSYNNHLSKAMALHSKHGKQMYAPIDRVKDHVKTYINSTVRTGEKPSPEGLQHHIISSYAKDIDKLKTDKAKDKKVEELKQKTTHIEANKKHFDNFLKMHGHLQDAKNVLVHTLAQHTGGLEHSVAGEKVKPEGFVVNHEGKPTKLNDRAEFNRLNFLARKQ